MIWSIQFLICFYYIIASVVSEPSTTSEFPTPTPSTLVDILSSQVEYSYFLRHLQRNGMIPILNSLSNVTLLAPVNLAFTSGSDEDVDKELLNDNNILLRYVINQRFRVGYLGREKVIYNTLYEIEGTPYPLVISPDFEHAEYIVDDTAAIVEVDIHAKHQDSFVQGIDSLLPLKPRVCDLLLSDNDNATLGPHLMSFMKQLFRQLFEDHGSISEADYENYIEISGNERSSLSKLPLSCKEFMSRSKTFLMLSDAYVAESLPDITRQYLLSLTKHSSGKKYSMTKEAKLEVKNDIVNFLESLMINHLIGGVNGTSGGYLSINGRGEFNFSIKKDTGQLLLNNKIPSSINASNLALSDAILHVFDIQNQTYHNFFLDLNVPLISILPRKALYAMRYSNFVKELNFRSLHHLVDGSTKNQTILAESSQRDQVESDFSPSSYDGSHFNYKQIMYYQFSDQMIDFEDISEILKYESFYKLLDSKLCSRTKIGSCFKTKFSASYNADLKKIEATINDDINMLFPGVKADNDNVIYIVGEEISPPLSLKQSLLKLLSNGGVSRHLQNFEIDRRSFLSTLRYLEQFDLLSLPENKKGYSIFLPCGYVEQEENRNMLNKKRKIREPWKSMGLILNFLESNPEYFKDLLKGLFVEDTIYSDFGMYDQRDRTTSINLRGDSVNIVHSCVDENYNNVFSLNTTELSIPLNSDILFNQGVIHIINEVLLPESFRISFSDLIKTTEDPRYPNFSFLNLIGTYPKLSDILGISDETINPSYSLLIPSADSLKDFNITSDFTKLWDFLEFHLIPNSELNALISCVDGLNPTNESFDFEYTVKTNLSDTILSCRRDPVRDKVFLRLKSTDTVSTDSNFDSMSYNKDREVQILSHGCTSVYNDSSLDGACVFLINKPLNLKWLEDPDKNTFLHIHIGFISVGVGIILGLLLFGLVIFSVFMFITPSRIEQPPPLSTNSNDSRFGENELTYMRIQTGDNDNAYDQGYETDDDFLRAESDHLLPLHGKKTRRPMYGSINNVEGAGTAPVSIRGNNITKALNRERNLPGGI